MNKIKNIKKKIEDNIICRIIKYIVYIVVVLLLIVILVQKVTNNNLSVGGFRIFMVVSKSMMNDYRVGDILVSKSVTEDEINIGDNVTYLGKKKELKGLIITHQVIKKEKRDGTTYFVTKGIANSVPDPEISYDQVYGKIVYKMVFLSMLGRLLNNQVSYYLIFLIVGLIVSIEIVSSIFDSKEEEEEDERAE